MHQLLRRIVTDAKLPPTGIHGVFHWARVLENGRLLAGINGADLRVVELFAVLHDSCRRNDGHDPRHGPRAAVYASQLHGEFFELEPHELRLLVTACETHTFGREHPDITVCTCWDSDRLDLGRLGIVPDPHRLTTEAARAPDIIDTAYERGLQEYIPSWIEKEWRLSEIFS